MTTATTPNFADKPIWTLPFCDAFFLAIFPITGYNSKI